MELIESGLFQTAQIRLGGSWVDTEGKWQVYPPKVAVIYLWWAGATLFQWGTWISIPHSKVINNYPHLSGDMPCIELGVYHGYCPSSDWNAHPSKYIYIYTFNTLNLAGHFYIVVDTTTWGVKCIEPYLGWWGNIVWDIPTWSETLLDCWWRFLVYVDIDWLLIRSQTSWIKHDQTIPDGCHIFWAICYWPDVEPWLIHLGQQEWYGMIPLNSWTRRLKKLCPSCTQGTSSALCRRAADGSPGKKSAEIDIHGILVPICAAWFWDLRITSISPMFWWVNHVKKPIIEG